MRDELTGCISVSLHCSTINDILVGTVPRVVIESIRVRQTRWTVDDTGTMSMSCFHRGAYRWVCVASGEAKMECLFSHSVCSVLSSCEHEAAIHAPGLLIR